MENEETSQILTLDGKSTPNTRPDGRTDSHLSLEAAEASSRNSPARAGEDIEETKQNSTVNKDDVDSIPDTFGGDCPADTVPQPRNDTTSQDIMASINEGAKTCSPSAFSNENLPIDGTSTSQEARAPVYRQQLEERLQVEALDEAGKASALGDFKGQGGDGQNGGKNGGTNKVQGENNKNVVLPQKHVGGVNKSTDFVHLLRDCRFKDPAIVMICDESYYTIANFSTIT